MSKQNPSPVAVDGDKNYYGFSPKKLFDKSSIFEGNHNLGVINYYLNEISDIMVNIPDKDASILSKVVFAYDFCLSIVDRFFSTDPVKHIEKNKEKFRPLDFGNQITTQHIYKILTTLILDEPSEYIKLPNTHSYRYSSGLNFSRFDLVNGYLYALASTSDPSDNDELQLFGSKYVTEKDLLDLVWAYFNDSISLDLDSEDDVSFAEMDKTHYCLYGNSIKIVNELIREHKFYKEQKIARNYLLIGDPGTGKTVIVNKMLAKFKGRSLFVSGADLETQIHNIENLFSVMNPDFIVFDDVDRCSYDSSLVRRFLRMINTLKDKKTDISFIYCANSFDGLLSDDAFTRKGRIDKIIEVKKPSKKDAVVIFERYLKKYKITLSEEDKAFCIENVEGFTGAEIFDLCVQLLRKANPKQIFQNEALLSGIRKKYAPKDPFC